MKTELSIIFASYLKSINYEDNKIIEIIKTKDSKFGDYTSNISLKIAKKIGKKPMEIAEEIKIFIEENYSELVEKVTVTKPGFVNLFLNIKFSLDQSLLFFDKEYKPRFDSIDKLKINYEYVSANPTGDLHIGHARNAVVGGIVVNVLRYVGHNVFTEYYINDGGNQIQVLVESVYYYLAKLMSFKTNLTKDNVAYHGKEIIAYAKLLFDNGIKFESEDESERIDSLKDKASKYFLDEIDNILKALLIPDFDLYTSEKDLIENNVDEMLNLMFESGNTFEKDGATWIEVSKFGDEKDRVLIKSDGTYTYMVADVANHVNKNNKGFDLMIDLWGKDHHGYEPRIQASLRALGINDKLQVDYISMVQITSNNEIVKMSKRAGTSLRIKDILKEMDVDVFKYFIVSKSKEQEMEIDIDLVSKKDLSNPYYYTQYANARIYQIIENYKSKFGDIKLSKDFSLLGKEPKERELIIKMNEFTDVISLVSREREPSILINYAKELAKVFNSFYASCKVISENEKLSCQRICLMVSLKNLFYALFHLMGITPINKI